MFESFLTSNGLVAACTNDPTNADPGDPTKPGWGFGDVNHCHTGPPGQT